MIVNAQECSYFWTRHAGQDTDFGTDDGFEVVRREVSMKPPVPSHWDVFSSFPSLAGAAEEFESASLLEETQVPLEGTTMHLHAEGRFNLRLEATFPEGMQSNSGLFSFTLRDSHGDLVKNAEVRGMTCSPSSLIGMYRYITTYPGTRAAELEFELPPGIHVERVTLMPFGANAKPFTVHSLTVMQSLNCE